MNQLYLLSSRRKLTRALLHPGIQAEITTYVECLGQFTSEQFPEDIAEVFLALISTQIFRFREIHSNHTDMEEKSYVLWI